MKFLRFAVLLFSIFPIFSQAQVNVALDQQLKAYHRLNQFNGTVLVAKNDKIIYQNAFGNANNEWKIPNTIDTRFRIASLTKQFTAALILLLKQEHKIALNDKISKYLPEFRKDVADRVTIHQLLTHTSGIKDYTNRPDFFTTTSFNSYQPRDFIQRFCADTLEFAPGSTYHYSNTNYYILGAIIEEITHKPYATVLQNRILTPCGMKNTGVEYPEMLISQKASGYDQEFRKFAPAAYINLGATIYAAGGIYSTIGDLFLWNKSLFKGKLLSAENLKLMLTPDKNNYGYGLLVNRTSVPGIKGERTFIGHDGRINGFRSNMTYVPEDDEMVIMLTNTGVSGFGLDLNPITISIYNIMHHLPFSKPKPTIVALMGDKIDKGVADAIALFKSLKNQPASADYSNAEYDLNAFGYYLLGKQRTKDALSVFKLNTEEYPKSWNTFDSYAEALAADGQKEAAIKNYEISLALNAGNDHAKEQLKVLRGN